MNKFRNNQKGFTLVELLIVVAIIGILAAIAIPMFVQYKRGAVESKVEANLVTCVTVLAAQFTDDGTTELQCDPPGNGTAWTMSINGTTGEIIQTGWTGTYVDGYAVTCTIESNATTDMTDIECTAS